MIRTRTIVLSLTACFILSGCNDKIEEANTAPEKAAVAVEAEHSSENTTDTHQHSEAKSDGGLSVGELYANKQDYSGKTVTIKGNVVKVSEGIMGKNWIHIQDGTGAEGTNDIVFTSATQSAKVGDSVSATGTVAIDKDFGYGYLYAVIVEEASFSK